MMLPEIVESPGPVNKMSVVALESAKRRWDIRMKPDVEKLLRRWRLRELTPSEVLFLTGAGISNPPPTSFPLGGQLHELLISTFSSLTQAEIKALLKIKTWTFERTCDVILDECQKLKASAVVNWFWNLLTEIFIYRKSDAWNQSNDLHRYFRKHIDNGGRHFTANLDRFIELDSPYQVITTSMFEDPDVPLNVSGMVHEPRLYKFHGDCNTDPVEYQGFLHRIIKGGFGANTRRYWTEVLHSIKLVCVCGYGGFDNFDVNRYFEGQSQGMFKAKAIWIKYGKNRSLEIVPHSQLHHEARAMLSRFSESVVLNGEADELLNVLFQSTLPTISRLSGPVAAEYSAIFRINVEHVRRTPEFVHCSAAITERFRMVIHEEVLRNAHLKSLGRNGGRLPPYDPSAAANDYFEAEREVMRAT